MTPQEEKNYITPQGFKRLQDELQHLKFRERPEITRVVEWAAGNGDRSENGDYIYGKKRLREIDRRIVYLNKKIRNAAVVDPATVEAKDIRFGATVKVLDDDDRERTFTIVGVDEVEVERGRISWRSPVGRGLLKAKEGDYVDITTPKGTQSYEVLAVEYKALEE